MYRIEMKNICVALQGLILGFCFFVFKREGKWNFKRIVYFKKFQEKMFQNNIIFVDMVVFILVFRDESGNVFD